MSALASQPTSTSEAEPGNLQEPKTANGWFSRVAPGLLIGGLVVFFAVNNWIWLTENVTLSGWDRPRHLAYSLSYASILKSITLRSLFEAMVFDPVRPPLFAASSTIVMRLFGQSSDVATMINIAYMVILLTATYGIGRQWGGRRLGMLSIVILACFPMFYAMSRQFYLEFSLAAMVSLAVYLLLATEGFQRRGMSLLFGLAFGLGLLTKRTFPVFLLGPVAVVVLAAGLLPALWKRVRQRPRLFWKKAGVAFLGGLILAALWYLPNREAVQDFPLGDADLIVWWVLLSLTIYFASLPSAPLANAVAAFSLAAALASTWYLAHVDFVQRLALYGYGINDPRGRALRLDNPLTYLYYVRKLGNEHVSFVLFVLLVAVVFVAAVVAVHQQGSVGRAIRQVRTEGWAVLAWLGGAYALLSLSIYQEGRAFTPVIPAVALIFGAGLLRLPWRSVRWGLGALVVLLGAVQFAAVSYEPVHRLLPATTFSLPIWGQTSLPPEGMYIQLPDEGPTDHRYWIHPDVLKRMEARRQALGADSLSMGLLARTRQMNAGAFIYLILADYPNLRVESLIDGPDEASLQQRLFAHEFVLVKPKNVGITPGQEQVIQEIVDSAAHSSALATLFDRAFELESSYPLPDGDTAYLYRQRHPLPADYPAEGTTELAQQLSQSTRPGDAILLTPPQLVSRFAAAYTGPAEIDFVPESVQEMNAVASAHDRIVLVVGDDQVGPVQSLAQDWLNQNGFRAGHEWVDSLQVITYGAGATGRATAPSKVMQATLGEQIDLVGYHLGAEPWKPGAIVPLTLFWQARGPMTQDYSIFVHLVDDSGQLVAQTDSPPAGGSRPATGWREGEVIVDRHGLALPDTLPPGAYELRAGIYQPADGQRLPVQDPAGHPLGDYISLGKGTVALP